MELLKQPNQQPNKQLNKQLNPCLWNVREPVEGKDHEQQGATELRKRVITTELLLNYY
jgi:hypothetical protein